MNGLPEALYMRLVAARANCTCAAEARTAFSGLHEAGCAVVLRGGDLETLMRLISELSAEVRRLEDERAEW